MKKKSFETILAVVHEVTEVEIDDILSKRKDDDIMEAKVLLVWFCKLNGMSAYVITNFMGLKSEESVNKKLRSFHEWSAMSMMFRLYTKKIAAVLPARLEEVAEQGIPST